MAIPVFAGFAPAADSKKYSENTIGIQNLNINITLINELIFLHHNLGLIKITFYNIT